MMKKFKRIVFFRKSHSVILLVSALSTVNSFITQECRNYMHSCMSVESEHFNLEYLDFCAVGKC